MAAIVVLVLFFVFLLIRFLSKEDFGSYPLIRRV
jgi:hypothetical protein